MNKENAPPEPHIPVFEPLLAEILVGLSIPFRKDCLEKEIALHQKALRLFAQGEYFQAHEEWEALWRNREIGSPDRHAIQSLIRLCAAGVKSQGKNTRGGLHHLAGSRQHLHLVFSCAVEPTDWQSWKPFLDWLEKDSQPEENVQK